MVFKKLKEYVLGYLDRDLISRQAKSLLQNDAFLIAYESMQNRVLEQIMESDMMEADKREKLYLQYKAIEDLLFELNRLVNQPSQPNNEELGQGGI